MFVTGCPRSGTTLIQRMMSAHPQLAVANDTHFIPRALEKVDRRLVDMVLQQGDVALTGELVQRVSGYHRFYRLGVTDEQVQQAVQDADSYRQFVVGLYQAFATNQGKQFSGEKTPDYVRYLPLLHALFPWCKSIHIARDGRDTALSLMDWARDERGPARFALWRDNPLATTALWWRWQIESGLSAGRELGPARHLLVSYEKLVESPEAELRRVMEFLGLPYADDVVRFHEGKSQAGEGRSAKKAWLPPTSGLRNWQTQMNDQQQQWFELLAGDTLCELGYATRFMEFPTDLVRQADDYRERFETDVARRHPNG